MANQPGRGQSDPAYKIIEGLREQVRQLQQQLAEQQADVFVIGGHAVEPRESYIAITRPDGSTLYLWPDASNQWVGGSAPPQPE